MVIAYQAAVLTVNSHECKEVSFLLQTYSQANTLSEAEDPELRAEVETPTVSVHAIVFARASLAFEGRDLRE